MWACSLPTHLFVNVTTVESKSGAQAPHKHTRVRHGIHLVLDPLVRGEK